MRQLYVLRSILRKLQDVPLPKTKRRSKASVSQSGASSLARRRPTSVTANVCNDIYKKFNVVGFSRHDVKNKLGNWLQGLDYENTEDLVQI